MSEEKTNPEMNEEMNGEINEELRNETAENTAEKALEAAASAEAPETAAAAAETAAEAPIKKKKKLTKKRLALRIVLIVLAVILAVVGSYVIYVFTSYHRLPDNLELTPEPDPLKYDAMNRLPPERINVEPGQKTYTIMTYNIGFGAYTSDYSFFMDGGKYSWARSKDGLNQNLVDMSSAIRSYDPDFLLLQEVDEDGTRTYHVNEVNYMCALLDYFQHVYAQNFDSPFLFWPLWQPHGANKSGLLTLSSAYISSALRRSLPVSNSVTKIVDLDRCYSITRIPLGDPTPLPLDRGEKTADPASDPTDSDTKELVLINVHLSAYSTGSVREKQLEMLYGDLQKEYDKGNYVICGGDFNHNLRGGDDDKAPSWAQPFPMETLPDGFHFGFLKDANGKSDPEVNIDHNSCRDANEPYNPDTTFTVLADGFLVSDNIEVTYYESVDTQYTYSDHDPVLMEFRLLEEDA